jgi:hypothetical protein
MGVAADSAGIRRAGDAASPALAKEAGSSLWARGFVYLVDFVDT